MDQSQNETASSHLLGQRKEPSLLKWFDKSAERIIKNHRQGQNVKSPIVLPAFQKLNIGIDTSEKIAEASASRVQIATDLSNEINSEFIDAMDKFIQAEDIVKFSQALEAAEEAVQHAPPHLIEEFALAGARGFQSEITGSVQGTLPGDNPLEVIGYVGITKPKLINKPKN